MMGIFYEPDWKIYEHLVYDALIQEYPDLAIEKNIHIVGHETKKRRQIDIAIKGKLAGHDVFAVIDCKHYSRNLDANDVGKFSALLKDVGADFGIIITQEGFSEAAENLAKMNRIKLEVRALEELEYYIFPIDWCEECSPGEDHSPGFIVWSGFEELHGDLDKVKEIGYCDWCHSLHLRCKCNAVIGIPEVFYNESVECLGECGTKYFVIPEYAGSGVMEYILTVKPER
jgi:hypothetical protein